MISSNPIHNIPDGSFCFLFLVFSQWLVLDPLIGCWLLNPDEPPHSFKDILKSLKLPEVMEFYDHGGPLNILLPNFIPSQECNSTEKQLEKLSECTQVLYESLTKNGTWKLFLHVEMRITAILACKVLISH